MSKYRMQHEIDRLDWTGVWKKGKVVHELSARTSGFWAKRDDLHSEIETRSLEGALEPKILPELKNQIRQYAASFDEVELGVQSLKKTLRQMLKPKHIIQREYFEIVVRKENQKWSLVAPLNQGCSAGIQSWFFRLKEFFSTEMDVGHFSFRQVELMKPAFAQLLYQALGCRQNPRHFSEPIVWPKEWKSFPSCNFDVWDTPGESGWLGYTPYSDDGVMGKPVKVYDGTTGAMDLISEKTGNHRFLDFHKMPELETRSLLVKSTNEKPPKDRQSTLIIENCESVTLRGSNIDIVTNMQWMMSPYRKMLRLPPLKVTIPIKAMPRFQVFGDSQAHHLMDGNPGRLSTSLGVTVKCSSAWARSRLGGISFEPL